MGRQTYSKTTYRDIDIHTYIQIHTDRQIDRQMYACTGKQTYIQEKESHGDIHTYIEIYTDSDKHTYR